MDVSSLHSLILYLQIYRKAALNIVRELGEDALPEPALATETTAEAPVDKTTVESHIPESNAPAPEAIPKQGTSSAEKPSAEDMNTVTTEEREPFKVPDTVKVRINPDNLKDYVGPPVYQKDRMYANPPPPGVSTGLGYLGNGSGAVMPIEATVCQDKFFVL